MSIETQDQVVELSEYGRACYDEGKAFCDLNGIPYATFDGELICRVDDVRKAVGKPERDPSKFCCVHEVPHLLWALDNPYA